MSESNLQGIMNVTMDKLRAMVDADTIIGTPFTIGNVTLIPVSKVSFGLATGGSDFSNKNGNAPLFGGGGGAGVTVSPVAFIAVNGDNVHMMPIYNELGTIDKAINMAPEFIDKVKSLFVKEEKTEKKPTKE